MTSTNEEKERADFEAWLLQEHGLDATWEPERNCFKEFPAHLAWKAWQGRAALRAESVAIHQWRNKSLPHWLDSSYEDAYSRVDEFYEARTLYTAPQTEPKDTGSEI